MAYFFFIYRYCPATNPLYSLKDKVCYDVCPIKQLPQSPLCCSCHYSCDTCNGTLLTNCVTCATSTPTRTL